MLQTLRLLLMTLLLVTTACVVVFAQGTAFTYQGRLTDSKLPLMLLQAVKEQQSLIQTQQQQIAGLKKLICRTHRRAAVCK